MQVQPNPNNNAAAPGFPPVNPGGSGAAAV